MFFKKTAETAITATINRFVRQAAMHERKAQELQKTIEQCMLQRDFHKSEIEKLDITVNAIINRNLPPLTLTNDELSNAMHGFAAGESIELIEPNGLVK